MDNSKFSVFSTTYIDKTKENNLYIIKPTNLYVHWDLLLSDMLIFYIPNFDLKNTNIWYKIKLR